MTCFVALLRGVNLGKRQLKMADLKRLAADLGLEDPQTYIASGNLLFDTERSEAALKMSLEAALQQHMGATVGVLLRTGSELAAVVKANPFADEPGNRVVALFLDDPAATGALEAAKNVSNERMALGKREIYVHYPDGQGRSKLRIPAADKGTARNMNSVGKLAELARERK